MAEDKVVVVTGAAGGLGSEIVGQLSARGAVVLATDLNEKALRDCAAERKSRGEIVVHPANITDPAAVKRLIQVAIDRWGKLDALSNNAAIQGAVKPFLTYDDDELWRVMQTNFYSCWLTMKVAIPHMIRTGGGAIVNTGLFARLPRLEGSAGVCVVQARACRLDKIGGDRARKR